MSFLPSWLTKLIDGLKTLPWIWEKSAQRYAFYLIKKDKSYLESLWNSISTAKDNLKECNICCNFCEEFICSICSNKLRDQSVICVVENPFDIISIERPWIYKWSYHVLHWILSPIDWIGPNDIRLAKLYEKINKWDTKEVILAINPSLEGEATNTYIQQNIPKKWIKITALARWISIGWDLEFTDDLTISKAIEARIEY